MTLQFVVFDATGDAGLRAGHLEALLKRRGFSPRAEVDPASSNTTVLLCHERDRGRLAGRLEELSKKARLVVLYSDGPLTARFESGVYFRSLADIEHILNLSHTSWSVEQFADLLNEDWLRTRRDGFTALAILALCAGLKSDLPAVARRRQEGWKIDPSKWAVVLDGLPLSDLQTCARQEGKSEADSLLTWIATGDARPDFLLAAKEAAALA